MRVRLLVVLAFVGMAAVPILLARYAGVGFVPAPQQASAESTQSGTTSSAAVTSLVWPDKPLGLAASDDRIVWEQRDRSEDVAGLWSYDVRSGDKVKLFGRRTTGKSSGFPAAAGDLVVWSAWKGRRGVGPPAIRALDSVSGRRWDVAAKGVDPIASFQSVLWVEPDGAGPGDDVIHRVNALTDWESSVTPGGGVRAFAAWGRWVAWISDEDGAVWAGSLEDDTRYRLAASGTAVAADHDHIAWATAVGRHSTVIVSWDRRSNRSTVLCRLAGAGASLSLSRQYAAWVMERKKTGPKVWVYDFGQSKAYQVSDSGGRQVSPVIVAGTVYWADDRSGHWELYSRSLQH